MRTHGRSEGGSRPSFTFLVTFLSACFVTYAIDGIL